MHTYMMLIKGRGEIDQNPEKVSKRVQAAREWTASLGEHYGGGNKLEAKGVRIANHNETYTDGPFLEANEIVAGYMLLQAESIDEAVEMAKTCPLLNDYELHVRPLFVYDK